MPNAEAKEAAALALQKVTEMIIMGIGGDNRRGGQRQTIKTWLSSTKC